MRPDGAAGAGTVMTRIGEILVELIARNLLEKEEEARVEAYAQRHETGICGALLSLGLIPEKTLVDQLADIMHLPRMDPDLYPLMPLLEEKVSRAYIRRHRVLPVEVTDATITLAVSDPFDDFAVTAFELLAERDVRLTLASPSELDDAIQRLYGGGKSSIDEIVDGIGDNDVVAGDEAQRLSDLASEVPIVRLVNLMIARSVEAGASDIHFEIYEKKLLVRYRIDGVLHDLEAPPQHAAPAVTSRIKIMAKLNIAERRLPQDGRIRMTVRGKIVDFRVSIVPTLHGERIVMRILDRGSTPKTLDDLGLSSHVQERLRQVLSRPNGIFLVTGPTGSGKTTTLYASLLTLPAKQKNILTVEDPIEFQLQDINQIQVKPQIGLTFASILRSILRQDPDIIFVGEIRDQETADIAVHAALTGHLVLSTLHTNTAAGAITRLLDMGIEHYLLTTVVEGVMAQRLVRCLCPACREAEILVEGGGEEQILRRVRAEGDLIVYRPKGCPKCNYTGYRGRQAIAELFIPNERTHQLVARQASAREIHEAAVTDGMIPMLDDGLAKVLGGVTSLDEVLQAVADGN